MRKEILFTDVELLDSITQQAVKKLLKPNTILLSPGDTIKFIPIVIKGSIRIVLQNKEGREYFLYYIFPGESCAMSLSCCQASRKSEIKAVVEDETEILLVPINFVDEWMKYPEWKKFTSNTQAQRFSELLETIELIAFSKLDEQLLTYLNKRIQATGVRTIKITHQEIADELNSPREVITRLLHQLQIQKKVKLSRNAIEVFW
ncbi:MAG: Crp/Fnr family transcriptional regulator [Bacteroidetes bacterium]|nr:Crp/Fnr family transcriptional regulator [Bacteroidota bacterium]